MTGHGIERRRAPRARAEFAIRLGDDQSQEAQLKDLSTNGLACFHGESVPEMTLVRIGMQLPGNDDVHEVQGAVVRCVKKRGVTPPTYELAIYFTEVPPICRQKIAEYVAGQLVV